MTTGEVWLLVGVVTNKYFSCHFKQEEPEGIRLLVTRSIKAKIKRRLLRHILHGFTCKVFHLVKISITFIMSFHNEKKE